MVNVSHYTYNRWSWNKCSRIFLFLLKKLSNDIYLHLMLTDTVKLKCNLLSSIKINFLVNCYNSSLKEKSLNYCCRLKLHLLGKLLDCKHIRKYKCLDCILFLLWLLCYRLIILNSLFKSLGVLFFVLAVILIAVI